MWPNYPGGDMNSCITFVRRYKGDIYNIHCIFIHIFIYIWIVSVVVVWTDWFASTQGCVRIDFSVRLWSSRLSFLLSFSSFNHSLPIKRTQRVHRLVQCCFFFFKLFRVSMARLPVFFCTFWSLEDEDEWIRAHANNMETLYWSTQHAGLLFG